MLTVLVGLTGCDQTPYLVTKADKEWDAAVDANNGAQAVLYLSNASIEHGDKIATMALTATKSQVKALPAYERFEVLQARLLMKLDGLKTIDGRTFYAGCVNHGWVYSTSVLRRQKVVVGGTKTSAVIYYKMPPNAPPLRSQWFLEDRQWKCDITRIDGDPDAHWLEEARVEGKSVDDYMIAQLEELNGDQLSSSIWEPVAPAKKK